jgi:ATP-dependent DNA helicase PIF1
MRVHNDRWFVDYLLRVGNGTEKTHEEGNIRLPQDICVPSMGEVPDIDKLIDHETYMVVFPTQVESL